MKLKFLSFYHTRSSRQPPHAWLKMQLFQLKLQYKTCKPSTAKRLETRIRYIEKQLGNKL